MIEVIYAEEEYFRSFHQALNRVAKERIYLEMIEAPSLDKVEAFQAGLIRNNSPTYYAIENEKVVGWCDIVRSENPRMNHRGNMGMGIIPEFRGQGVGTKLLSEALDHAKKIGLEKVELQVNVANAPAIALYKKLGFEVEGTIKKYRKLDGIYFDCMFMGKFL